MARRFFVALKGADHRHGSQGRTKKAPVIRLGRRTPTRGIVLPYTSSLGGQAVDLYAQTGRIAQEWQQLLLYDIMATNADSLWVHTKFGYAVPRRNGKNEIVAMRELWGLQNGENMLHTAHRTTTSHAAWERLRVLLGNAHIGYKAIRAKGNRPIQYYRLAQRRISYVAMTVLRRDAEKTIVAQRIPAFC